MYCFSLSVSLACFEGRSEALQLAKWVKRCFFLSRDCMAQRHHCRDGFSSVSYSKVKRVKTWETLWRALDLKHVFRSKKVFIFGAMEDITNDEYLARSSSLSIVLLSIQFILMSFLFHRRMLKYPESTIFVDIFCIENDLDAAYLMDSGFSKAGRNLQFWICHAFFMAGAGRGQPYGFRFCESFAQFAAFGLARCILCRRAGRGQPYNHFSWQALCKSGNRKVRNA